MRTRAFSLLTISLLAFPAAGCSKQALPTSADFGSMKLQNLVLESEQRAKRAPQQLARIREEQTRSIQQLQEAERLTAEARSAARETVGSKNYHSR